MAASMVHFGAFLWALRSLLGQALERAFLKTSECCLLCLSIPADLDTLPEGRAQEYSLLAQDWALFLHFVAGFMCILGLLSRLF